MFAMARNNSKFSARDKRVIKNQHIEKNPFAKFLFNTETSKIFVEELLSN